MYCSKCGAVLRENAKFCEKCGTAVAAIPAPPVNNPAVHSKANPFAFVSAGIMGLMLLLYFLPWFFVGDSMSGVFSYYIGCMPLVYPDDTAVILFLIFTFIGMGLLIPGIIVAITRKRRVPVAFAVISSIAINLALIFFAFTKEAWTIGVSIVPVILFLMSYVNIALAIPAKVR